MKRCLLAVSLVLIVSPATCTARTLPSSTSRLSAKSYASRSTSHPPAARATRRGRCNRRGRLTTRGCWSALTGTAAPARRRFSIISSSTWLGDGRRIVFTTPRDLTRLPGTAKRVWTTKLAAFDLATRTVTTLASDLANHEGLTLCGGR